MKKIVISFIMTLLIVLGIVMMKNCFSYMIPNDAMGIRAVIQREHVSQLFLGASSYRKGIDILAVEEQLPGESFVLTYNGNQPLNMELELEEMFAQNTKIDTLIVDLNPSMMDEPANLSDKRLLWDTGFSTKWQLWKEIAKREDTDFFAFYDYFVLSNNEYMLTYPISYPLISARYYKGGSLDEDEGTTADKLEELEIDEQDMLHPTQVAALESIIQMCKEQKIRLIFVETPRYLRLEQNSAYQKKLAEAVALAETSKVECLYSGNMEFDYTNPEYYTDLVHMSTKGRQAFTQEIIHYLTKLE